MFLTSNRRKTFDATPNIATQLAAGQVAHFSPVGPLERALEKNFNFTRLIIDIGFRRIYDPLLRLILNITPQASS